jgi:hypothetical protein
MTEGWGGCTGPSSDEARTSDARPELTLFDVAERIEERAINDARSMVHSLGDAPEVLAAFAVADRLRALAIAAAAQRGET